MSIEIDKSSLLRLELALAHIKDGAKRAAAGAINKTLPTVRTHASQLIRQEVTIKSEYAKKTMYLQYANSGRVVAKFSVRSGQQPLARFDVRQVKQGVSVKVRRNKPRKVIREAFIITFASGHKAVVWRKYGHRKDPKAVRPGLAYARLKHEFRFPLGQLFGPRTSDIVSNPEVMNALLAKGNERLKANLESQTDWLLSTAP
jgi:hypothetical protein